jgi:putative ubiquitin-RnfH superfamily antitoxin RatB of RatAB toxin-antitoxin module
VTRKQCVVAYATPTRQYLWTLDLPADATIQQALDEARRTSGVEDVPWDEADVGLFGEIKSRSEIPRDGDRIEIYRPLAQDPKESRRDRVKRLRNQPKQSRPRQNQK